MVKIKDQPFEAVKPEPEKLRFLEWFVRALDLFDGVKPHHMNEVRAYFIYLGIADPSTIEEFNAAMDKFGFRRKG